MFFIPPELYTYFFHVRKIYYYDLNPKITTVSSLSVCTYNTGHNRARAQHRNERKKRKNAKSSLYKLPQFSSLYDKRFTDQQQWSEDDDKE